MQLTQKERSLLKDQLSHEEICIQKYNKYANQVQDPQLKQMLQQFASQEQQHYDTINQILQGQQPNLGGGQQQQQKPQFPNLLQDNQASQQDAFMLQDLLMTEKYVSSAYNTTIFESVNPTLRQTLQHIQKEEQQHGEGLFNYMQQHGLYNPQ